MLFMGRLTALLIRRQCRTVLVRQPCSDDPIGQHMAPASFCGGRAGCGGQGVCCGILHGCGGAITSCYCGCGRPSWCCNQAGPSDGGAGGRGQARAACGSIAVLVVAALAFMQEGFWCLFGSCCCDLQQCCVLGLTDNLTPQVLPCFECVLRCNHTIILLQHNENVWRACVTCLMPHLTWSGLAAFEPSQPFHVLWDPV